MGDQRSTILAVDNMNGAQLLNRTIRDDHVQKYKAPKKLDEENVDENGDAKMIEYQATGAEGRGHQVYNVTKGQSKITEVVDGKRDKPGKAGKQDEDEAWAAAFEQGLEDEAEMERIREEKAALKREMKEIEKRKKEAKKLKKEAKKAKKEKKKKKEKKASKTDAAADARPAKKVKKEASSGSGSG